MKVKLISILTAITLSITSCIGPDIPDFSRNGFIIHEMEGYQDSLCFYKIKGVGGHYFTFISPVIIGRKGQFQIGDTIHLTK